MGVVATRPGTQDHQASPPVAKDDYLRAFADGAKSDGADGGSETGNVAASGKDTDDASLVVDVGHKSRIALRWMSNEKLSSSLKFLRIAAGGRRFLATGTKSTIGGRDEI